MYDNDLEVFESGLIHQDLSIDRALKEEADYKRWLTTQVCRNFTLDEVMDLLRTFINKCQVP